MIVPRCCGDRLSVAQQLVAAGLLLICVTAWRLHANDCRFAYVEFVDPESVDLAMALNGSNFRGRELKVRHLHVCMP